MGGKSSRGRMGPVLIAMLEPSWDFGVVYVLLCYKEVRGGGQSLLLEGFAGGCTGY